MKSLFLHFDVLFCPAQRLVLAGGTCPIEGLCGLHRIAASFTAPSKRHAPLARFKELRGYGKLGLGQGVRLKQAHLWFCF
jgi:hypothetical protein